MLIFNFQYPISKQILIQVWSLPSTGPEGPLRPSNGRTYPSESKTNVQNRKPSLFFTRTKHHYVLHRGSDWQKVVSSGRFHPSFFLIIIRKMLF